MTDEAYRAKQALQEHREVNMRYGDTFVSVEDMGNGELLERVINKGGQPYSLILVGGVERASCPTQDEAMMLAWWEREGRKMYE